MFRRDISLRVEQIYNDYGRTRGDGDVVLCKVKNK